MELVSMYLSIEALRDRLQEESDLLCLKAEHIEECAERRGIGLTQPENRYIKELNQMEGKYDEAITHLTRALTVLDRIGRMKRKEYRVLFNEPTYLQRLMSKELINALGKVDPLEVREYYCTSGQAESYHYSLRGVVEDDNLSVNEVLQDLEYLAMKGEEEE